MRSQDVTHSFLAMPNEWEKRTEYWKELTSGGKLWRKLRQLVSQRAPDETFENLRADLEEWRDFVSAELRNGKSQLELASRLLELAQLAAAQPNDRDELLDRASFSISAWEWDAFCDLRSSRRVPISNTRRSLSVLFEQSAGREGCLAVLEVELVDNGRGEIYSTPQHNWFIVFEQTFKEAYEQAWALAQNDAAPKAEDRRKLHQVDARFRLKHVSIPHYFNPPLDDVGGNSAQAAFYLCLLHAAKAYLDKPDALLLEASVAVTATLRYENDGLLLGAVDGLNAKMEAAYLKGLRTVIVATEIEEQAKAALEDAKRRWTEESPNYSAPTRVVGSEDPASAAEEASGLAHDLIMYLDALVKTLDTTPWYRDGQPIRASAVAIPARVIKEEVEKTPARMPMSEDEEKEREGEREPAYRYVDPELAELYEEPTLRTRKTVVPWEQELEQIKRTVILGAPGGGKSFLRTSRRLTSRNAPLRNCRKDGLPWIASLSRFTWNWQTLLNKISRLTLPKR